MESVSEKVDTVKEEVKQSLVTIEEDVTLSAQARSDFMQHALQDEQTGEWYMDEAQFVNAVAPPNLDYVCHSNKSYLHSLSPILTLTLIPTYPFHHPVHTPSRTFRLDHT